MTSLIEAALTDLARAETPHDLDRARRNAEWLLQLRVSKLVCLLELALERVSDR